MKILLTGPALNDMGGVASYYNAVLSYLRAKEGLNIHYMEIGGTKKIGGMLHPIADQIRFRRTLSDVKPALVHVNPSLNLKSFLRDGLFVLQAKSLGYQVIVFFHGWDATFEAAVKGLWLWFFKRTFLRGDEFIVLATSFKDRLVKWGVTVPIHLGTTAVSSDLVHGFSMEEKSERLATEPAIKVLFLARLEQEKGVMETMEAVTMLRKEERPVMLTVAGDGPAMVAVREYVRVHDPDNEYLYVAGDVRGEKKKALFATHHIYCFPTTYGEGMPTSVLEAMAFGMPVITCPTGGLRDFFEDGVMGYLVKQRTPGDVANALKKLIDNRNVMLDIATRNYRYASERFLAPRVASYLADAYLRVAPAMKN